MGDSFKIGKALNNLVKAFTPPPPPPAPPPPPPVSVVNTVVAKVLPMIQSGSRSNTFTPAGSAGTGGQAPVVPVSGSAPRPPTPAATSESDAALQIKNLLAGPVFSPTNGWQYQSPSTAPYGGTLVQDAQDVVGSDGVPGFEFVDQQVEQMLASNRPLEQAALAQLSPAEHALYTSIRAVTDEDNDSRASLALQGLLFEGKLTSSLSSTNTSLLTELGNIANLKTPLDPNINRFALLTDTLRELGTPAAINQGPRGTCTATVVGIDLALSNPAEYARIVGGLASPAGTVALASGVVVTREPGTALPDDTGRSASQKLMAPVFMELANEEDGSAPRDYNDATGENWGGGVTGVERLFEAVNGHPIDSEKFFTVQLNPDNTYALLPVDADVREDAFKRIELHLEEGLNVPVSIQIQQDLTVRADTDIYQHKVLVTGTETVAGVDYVNYTNPWGQVERMPQDAFVDRMMDVNFPRRFTLVEQWSEAAVDGLGDLQKFIKGDAPG